jgi:hypothetical protein
MVATTWIKNLHDMTRATFIQRPVSNMDHTNQNKPVLANQLFYMLRNDESVYTVMMMIIMAIFVFIPIMSCQDLI